MNGRAIPGAYLFRLYVCDKEIFSLTFTRLMSTTVDVPNRQPLNVTFYIFIQQI